MIKFEQFLEVPGCPLCGSGKRRDLGRLGYGPSPLLFSGELIDLSALEPRLFACSGCSCRWTSPILPPHDINELYARSQPARWSRNGATHFERLLNRAGVTLPQGAGDVLDYGCFTGGLLDLFAQHGWRTHGTDLCEAAVAIASEKGHRSVAGDDTAVQKVGDSFDLITVFDVVEHLVDPSALLRQLRGALKGGGEIWILTGDAGCQASRLLGAAWWYACFCEHLVFYRRDNLTKLLKDAGFRDIEVKTVRYLELPLPIAVRNFIAAAAYACIQPRLGGWGRSRLTVGPPPQVPTVDHLFVRARV